MWWQICFSTYIAEFQAIHISLLSHPQDGTEKSGSIHIYRDGLSTQGKSYCMTHSTVTSNLQVVNIVQHWICEHWLLRCVYDLWGSAVIQYCTRKHYISASAAVSLLFLNELCPACRMINRTTPSIPCMARLRWPTQSTPLSHPHLQPLSVFSDTCTWPLPSNTTIRSMRSHRGELGWRLSDQKDMEGNRPLHTRFLYIQIFSLN